MREVAEELGVTLNPDDPRPGGMMFRNSQEPRVDIFFTAHSWEGTPQIREPHKCTELVRADPATLPDDALDFIAHAWHDTQNDREDQVRASRGISQRESGNFPA